jgi:hypothetical protein
VDDVAGGIVVRYCFALFSAAAFLTASLLVPFGEAFAEITEAPQQPSVQTPSEAPAPKTPSSSPPKAGTFPPKAPAISAETQPVPAPLPPSTPPRPAPTPVPPTHEVSGLPVVQGTKDDGNWTGQGLGGAGRGIWRNVRGTSRGIRN